MWGYKTPPHPKTTIKSMASTATLTFDKVGDSWVAAFVSQGACVIELERSTNGLVSVGANLSGMATVPVAQFSNPYKADTIFEVDVPEGVEVTIKSMTEVTNAKMLS